MNIEKERHAFEAWYQSIRGFGSLERWGEGYAYSLANNAWIAWQERASQPAWISVDDALPETEVLCKLINGKMSILILGDCYHEEYKNLWLDQHRNLAYRLEQVTHWMPIPAIPK